MFRQKSCIPKEFLIHFGIVFYSFALYQTVFVRKIHACVSIYFCQKYKFLNEGALID